MGVLEVTMSHRGTALLGERSPVQGLKEYIADWRGDRCQSLVRISRVLEYLGRPHTFVPAFHVTGTNGKGSIACSLASLLGALGLRTVLATSPHLQELNERVVLDGRKISDETLLELGTRVLTISRRLDVRLSQHEIMTSIAFLLARETHADFMVLEVGLGGRNDSTNVVSSTTVGVISNVGLDHVEMLGPTIEHIAKEKAGIIKSSMRGVVVGPVVPTAEAIIRQEASLHAVPTFFSGHDISVGEGHSEKEHVYYGPWFEGSFRGSLAGSHQVANMSLAIAAFGCMGLPVQQAIGGLTTAVWPGRLEFITNSAFTRPVLIDGAHNKDGVTSLVRYLQEKYAGVQFDFIFGALIGKDWQGMIDQLLPYSRSWGIVMPSSERAESNENISQYLTRTGVSSDAIIRLHDGLTLKQFINHRSSLDIPVVAFGSLYLIGDLRSKLGVTDRPYWHFVHSSQEL